MKLDRKSPNYMDRVERMNAMGFVMKIQFTDILQINSLKKSYADGKAYGYEFEVRLGYYRGLYLSCVEEFELIMDGTAVDEREITFCINGKEFAVSELKYLVSEFWLVTEPAKIKVTKPSCLAAGEHEVELRLILRSPYLPAPGSMGTHSYVPIDSSDKKILNLSC